MKLRILLIPALIFSLFSVPVIANSRHDTGNSESSSAEGQQATKVITGKVTDESGEPLAGAGVVLVGNTSYNALTDDNGNYSIRIPDSENAAMEFSFIGMKTATITVGNQNVINVVLKSENKLDEIVVVGYGTQKKVNLTGAVEQVTDEVFENRPMANVSQGLQGAIPNLNIQLTDGKPIRTASYNVRGTTSIGQGGSALVLIDGVEGDPAMLNPNDIASVSVLKDAASSAIYGARGAFGVVLITTKNPQKGHTVVNYTGNFSMRQPTVLPDYVTDGYEFTKTYVEAWGGAHEGSLPTRFHRSIPFDLQYYNDWENHKKGSGADEVVVRDGKYWYYGNTDWYDLLYKDWTYGQDHNVTVQGGNDVADFMVSGRFYDQDGIYTYNTDRYKMYNIRAKGSAKIFSWLKVENNFEYNQMKYHNPITVGSNGVIYYGMEGDEPPVGVMFNPDGTLTMSAAYGVGDLWYGKNYQNQKTRVLRNTTSATATFFDDKLIIKGDFTFRNQDRDVNTRRVQVPYSTAPNSIAYVGASTNDYQIQHSLTKYLAANIYAEYTDTFAEMHNFKGMIGYNYEQQDYDWASVRRNGNIFDDVENIALTNGDSITTGGSYNKWRIAGGFFRVNYDYNGRYLLEVNGRYDGSSKFPENDQWAFFPSVSAGWRVSQEPYWHVDPKYISSLKIRGSYGSLGNGNVSPYAYQELFSIWQMSRLIDGKRPQATSAPGVIPDNLTWETATTLNLGLDFGMFNGRLNFTGDYYVRKTKDMYTVGKTLPAVFGATSPYGNYADMTTKGWEITLTWNDSFELGGKPFNYDLRFTLADYQSKIDKYNNDTKSIGYYTDGRCNYYEGMKIGEIWGFVTEGLFTSEEDVANHADQGVFSISDSQKYLPGDIKFQDLNGDNVINYGTNCIGDTGDRKIIGNSTPRYTYSFNLGADWNGIFITAFFQGVGKMDWVPGYDNQRFFGQFSRPYGNMPKYVAENYWTEDNTDTYFPRLRGYTALQGNQILAVAQTRYLQNAAYIRLKNLQIGYTFPKKWFQRLKMEGARVYLSGENLWSWSPLYRHCKSYDIGNIYGEDPEMAESTPTNEIISNGGKTYSYPILRTYSLGISITF